MPEIRILKNEKELGKAAAREFLDTAAQTINRQGLFTVALSGGEGPRELFRNLALAGTKLEWEKVNFFWSDERLVPPQDARSNYGAAKKAFLDKLAVPESSVHRVKGEEPNPEQAALDYAHQLKVFFNTPEGEFPRFDLVLLGLGLDGHTASLFPASPALQEAEQVAVTAFCQDKKEWRVTLTPPVLNRAARVMFLAHGAEKADVLLETLRGEYRPELYPAQLIRPKSKELLWLLDEAAAASLR
jgi:6-phosphogluconolactonase